MCGRLSQRRLWRRLGKPDDGANNQATSDGGENHGTAAIHIRPPSIVGFWRLMGARNMQHCAPMRITDDDGVVGNIKHSTAAG